MAAGLVGDAGGVEPLAGLARERAGVGEERRGAVAGREFGRGEPAPRPADHGHGAAGEVRRAGVEVEGVGHHWMRRRRMAAMVEIAVTIQKRMTTLDSGTPSAS